MDILEIAGLIGLAAVWFIIVLSSNKLGGGNDIKVDASTLINTVVTIMALWLISLRFLYKRGSQDTHNDSHNHVLQDRYKYIYVPLRKLLLNIHISTCTSTSIKYPKISQRIKQAQRFFQRLDIRSGIQALFDMGKTSRCFSSVDYGGVFPLREISNIVEAHIECADQRLLILIQWANLSMYEEHRDEDLLTSEELSLADHIYDMYNHLNNIF